VKDGAFFKIEFATGDDHFDSVFRCFPPYTFSSPW